MASCLTALAPPVRPPDVWALGNLDLYIDIEREPKMALVRNRYRYGYLDLDLEVNIWLHEAMYLKYWVLGASGLLREPNMAS